MHAITAYFGVDCLSPQDIYMKCYNALYALYYPGKFCEAIAINSIVTAIAASWDGVRSQYTTDQLKCRLDDYFRIMRYAWRHQAATTFVTTIGDIRVLVMQRWFAPPSLGGPGYIETNMHIQALIKTNP